MTALAPVPARIEAPADRRPLVWLRERGMGASILIATLSAAFGVILIATTNYIGALLMASPLGGSETLQAVITVLSVLLIGIAMYVASIVTANTFATIVAGRTRQIALMRLIGASAKSERKAIAGKGLAVGVIGAVIGYVIGMAIVLVAVPILNDQFGVPDLIFTPFSVYTALPPVAVALTTWAAAWVGSRRVLAVTPLQALGGSVERSAEDVASKPRAAMALTLLIIGGALLVGGVLMGLLTPLAVIVAFLGGLISFTGLALGSTLFMPPILRLVGRIFGSSATAKLAAENALRHPERSSRMAIGVVMGVTLVTMFAVAAASAKAVMVESAGGDAKMITEISQILDGFASVMMALVSVSAVIAAVGLVNLLTIGIVQRTRELGLLRALGFTNSQVRRMVLLEAAHIAIASLATGLVLGIVYGWAGAQATLGAISVPPSYNAPTVIMPAVPWTLVVGIVVATAALTLVAAVVPTRLATRVAPVEALAAD